MEAIGKIGLPFFKGTSHKIAMGFCIAFSLLSLILYIVACAGWSTNGTNLQSASWAIVTETTNLSSGSVTVSISETVYFGLQQVYAVANSGSSSGSTSTTYSSCASAAGAPSYCSSCQTSGSAAFGLSLISLLMTLLLVPICFLRTFKDSAMFKIAGIFLTFLPLLFSIAAYGTFNQNCYNNIVSSLNSAKSAGFSFTSSQGPGFGAVVANSVFMFFMFALMVAVPAALPENISLDAAPTSPGQAEAGDKKVVVFDDDD